MGWRVDGARVGTAVGVVALCMSSGAVAFADTTELHGDKSAGKCVVAIDPGHNGEDVDDYDPVTGARMVDYPNGAEDADAMVVTDRVAELLSGDDIEVVKLKESVTDSVTYRDRVDKAVEAGATFAMSVHTTPGESWNLTQPQEVGQYREGVSADGGRYKVTFDNEDTAGKSGRWSDIMADHRTSEEGHDVSGESRLEFPSDDPPGYGNIPAISLISDEVPWLYNEYGVDADGEQSGGNAGVSDEDLVKYARGLYRGALGVLADSGCVDNLGERPSGTPKSGDRSVVRTANRMAARVAEDRKNMVLDAVESDGEQPENVDGEVSGK